MRELDRKRILRVGVLAAAAFQNQFDFDAVALPLIEVDDWRARTEVVAGVLSGDRVHGIGPQLAAAGVLGDGLANPPGHPDLVCYDPRADSKRRHAGVLADCPLRI